jgi:hypothetical protein
MAMHGGSCQGAVGEAQRTRRDRRNARRIDGPRAVRQPRPGRPEDELAQVMGAPDAAVADRRDGRHGHPDERQREGPAQNSRTRVPSDR